MYSPAVSVVYHQQHQAPTDAPSTTPSNPFMIGMNKLKLCGVPIAALGNRDAVVEANTALPLCVVEELLVGTASVDRADEEVVPLVVTVVAELLFGVVVTADPVTDATIDVTPLSDPDIEVFVAEGVPVLVVSVVEELLCEVIVAADPLTDMSIDTTPLSDPDIEVLIAEDDVLVEPEPPAETVYVEPPINVVAPSSTRVIAGPPIAETKVKYELVTGTAFVDEVVGGWNPDNSSMMDFQSSQSVKLRGEAITMPPSNKRRWIFANMIVIEVR